MAKILILGAHFDDAEIAMGGSLLIHKDKGDEIHIAVLFSDDNYAGKVAERKCEQMDSINYLKAELHTFVSATMIKHIVNRLDIINADILYFPYEVDYHQDHRFTSEVGLALSRNRGMSMVLKYLTLTSYNCYPNYLQLIDIISKKSLVEFFKSQIERRPEYMERMLAQDKFFGSLIPNGGDYAEGFIFHRMVQKRVLHE